MLTGMFIGMAVIAIRAVGVVHDLGFMPLRQYTVDIAGATAAAAG